MTMENVLESHGPRESLEPSIVRIGLETTELRVDNEMQIHTVVGGRPTPTTGFKLMPGNILRDNPAALADAIEQADPFARVVAVFLVRECAVSQFLLFQRAMRTGQWQTSTAPTAPTQVDVSSPRRYLDHIRLYHATVETALNDLRCRGIAVEQRLWTFERDIINVQHVTHTVCTLLRDALALPAINPGAVLRMQGTNTPEPKSVAAHVLNWADLPVD